jgi:8-oxo-dGTP pyrophosphatase MutT (NUDIX family)
MRAGAIIIDNQLIALIERFREGNHYFVFPGGGIEEGESLEDAVVREALEETGLEVVVDHLIAEVHYQDEKQFYYLVKIVGGEFGSGKGKEMLGLAPPEFGSYRSVWKNISELSMLNGWPRPLFEMISKIPDEGIPEDATIIRDPGGITATP